MTYMNIIFGITMTAAVVLVALYAWHFYDTYQFNKKYLRRIARSRLIAAAIGIETK